MPTENLYAFLPPFSRIEPLYTGYFFKKEIISSFFLSWFSHINVVCPLISIGLGMKFVFRSNRRKLDYKRKELDPDLGEQIFHRMECDSINIPVFDNASEGA